MKTQLPFFNWSLKRALATEPDSFIRARIGIIVTVVVFALIKACVVMGVSVANGQWLQLARAAFAFILYIVIAKWLLYRPHHLRVVAHVLIVLGVLIIFSNIFLYTHKINLITIQFVFMVMLSSFYTLGGRWGIFYSAISIGPVMAFFVVYGHVDITLAKSGQELASPGYEVMVALNFVSIAIVHYLFFEAFTESIREKEKLNKQLQVSVAEANKMAASRSNFLSTVSHELRTPLNSVVGIAELLMADNLEVKQKDNMKILQYSALDLLSLINNVLDFNKLDSDKLVLESMSFNLTEFMERICLGLKAKADDKQLRFVLDIDEDLENTIVVSDPTRLSQLIYNLVSNAIKFTEKGSVTVKLECISRKGDEVTVTFSVTDTGIGIHPDKHATIFDIFTQAESNTTRKFGGTGLGLAIVKQVLALFGSEIHLQSTHGAGTKFYFTIPFTTTTENSIMAPESQAAIPDFSELKILIAEDHNFNRIIIRKQFEALDMAPLIVEDGMAAFEACQASQFDAVFLDLHMPGLDGYETAKLIRQIPEKAKAQVHILAFTASVTEQQKILAGGFDGFLYKPLEMESLKEKLELIAALPGVRRPVAAL